MTDNSKLPSISVTTSTIALIIMYTILTSSVCGFNISFNQKFYTNNINQFDHKEVTAKQIIHNLFTNIQRQQDIDMLLLEYESDIEDYHGVINIFLKFNLPRMISNLNDSLPLVKMFNRNIFAIIYLKDLNHINKLNSLFKTLNGMRQTRMLFYIKSKQITQEDKLKDVQRLFEDCFTYQSLNVIALFEDFVEHQVFYTYKPFPNLTIEMKSFNNTIPNYYFPDRLKNIFGHILRTLPGREISRNNLLKVEPNGYPVMIGYVTNFIYLFAEHINATLRLAEINNYNDTFFYADLENFIRNNTIDITTALIPIVNLTYLPYYSYVFEINKICFMIPIAPYISVTHIIFYLANIKLLAINIISIWIFTVLLNWRQYQLRQFANHKANKQRPPPPPLNLFDFLLNDIAIRGILGASFPMPLNAERLMNVIYMLLTVTGLYLSVMYNAYLQTMLTYRPHGRQPRTTQDLVDDGINIYTSFAEWEYFEKTFPLPKKSKVTFASLDSFNYERERFNATYAYPTSITIWFSYFSQRQKIFAQQVFILPEDSCLPGRFYSAFALSDNSIYFDAVNELILHAEESGLTDFWKRSSFFELVKAKVFTYEDLSNEEALSNSLGLSNLKWLFMLYLITMFANSLIFLMELLISKRHILKRRFYMRFRSS